MTTPDKLTMQFLDAMTIDNDKYTKYVQHEILGTLRKNFLNSSDTESIKIVDQISEEIFGKSLLNHVKPMPMASVIAEDKDVSQIYIEQANSICKKLGMNVLINPSIPENGFNEKDFVVIDLHALDLSKNKGLYNIDYHQTFASVKNGMFLFDTNNVEYVDNGKNLLLDEHLNKWLIMKNFLISITMNEDDVNEISASLRTKLMFKVLTDAPEKTFKPEFSNTDLYKSLSTPKPVAKTVFWNKNDLIVERNLPGSGTLHYLGEEMRNAGVSYDRFAIMTPHIDLIKNGLIKENIERVKKNNTDVLILDFEFAVNKDTVESIKKTIQLAKDTGLQVVVVVPNHTINISGPSSTTHKFSNEKDLFLKLDDLAQIPDYSLKDGVVNAINSMKAKLGFGKRKDDLGIEGLPNKKM